jgi:hypothetical protein
MQQKEDIERLLTTCKIAEDCVDAFLRSVDVFIGWINGLPPVAKPLVRRDLEHNTGMTDEEWEAFLRKLSTRYSSICEAAQHVNSSVTNGGNDSEVAAATATLKEVSAPLLEAVDIAIEQVETMARYLEGLPYKIDMIPDTFLKTESRSELTSAVPISIERARALKELLEETKEELNAVAG